MSSLVADPCIIGYKDWGNGIASTGSAFLLEMEAVEYYLWGDSGDLMKCILYREAYFAQLELSP